MMVDTCDTEVIHTYHMLVFQKKKSQSSLKQKADVPQNLRGKKKRGKESTHKKSGDNEKTDCTRNLWVRYKNTNKREMDIKNITLH